MYEMSKNIIKIRKAKYYFADLFCLKTASTNDGLPEISKMKYWNRILELGTTISGFADNNNKHKN
jgi:hypothetical protein